MPIYINYPNIVTKYTDLCLDYTYFEGLNDIYALHSQRSKNTSPLTRSTFDVTNGF